MGLLKKEFKISTETVLFFTTISLLEGMQNPKGEHTSNEDESMTIDWITVSCSTSNV
jgi:hypothetical protein